MIVSPTFAEVMMLPLVSLKSMKTSSCIDDSDSAGGLSVASNCRRSAIVSIPSALMSTYWVPLAPSPSPPDGANGANACAPLTDRSV